MSTRIFYQIAAIIVGICVIALITLTDLNINFIKNRNIKNGYIEYQASTALPAHKIYQNMFPRQPINSTRQACLNGAFSEILIVITFNFPYYDNIALLHPFYSKVFGKVVSCGQETAGGIHHPNITADVGNGYFGYICMARAIEKYPGFKGYLYVNDDMVVNWWNLIDRDLKKVWQGPKTVDFTQTAYGPIIKKGWMWWTSDMGIQACQRAYKDLSYFAEQDKPHFDAKNALKTYLRNGNGKPCCGKGWSDFFFVPGHMSKTCQSLLEIYYKHKLFLEMSVMNLLHSLDDAKNFEVIAGIFLPDLWLQNSKDSREFWKIYNTKLTFVHPFKFGFEDYKEMNVALFKNWVLELSNSLTNC